VLPTAVSGTVGTRAPEPGPVQIGVPLRNVAPTDKESGTNWGRLRGQPLSIWHVG